MTTTRETMVGDMRHLADKLVLMFTKNALLISSILICGLFAVPVIALPKAPTTDDVVYAISSFSKPESDTGSPLLDAAKQGDIKTVAKLMETGWDPNEAIPGDGTALIIASSNNNLPMAELLLDYGADPNLGISGDGNPLIKAASYGHLDIAKLLLKAGADINMPVVSDGNPLIKAATGNHLKMAKFLIENGAVIDAMVPSDETALINAAQSGHLEMVKFLVEAGADPSLGMVANQTFRPQWRSPLSEALRMGHGDVAAYLRAHGAELGGPA